MGTIKKLIEIDDEDILNLKNGRGFIWRNMHHEPHYEPFEIFVIDDIVNKYEKQKYNGRRFIDVANCAECTRLGFKDNDYYCGITDKKLNDTEIDQIIPDHCPLIKCDEGMLDTMSTL